MYTKDKVSARYIKMVQTGGDTNYYWSIAEITIPNCDKGKQMEYIYDEKRRLNEEKNLGVSKFIYSYDNNGNLFGIQSVK